MKIILIFDILLMLVIILFPYQFDGIISVRIDHFNIFLILTCIYIVIKCILGIIIMAYKIKNKDYMLYSKKYLLFLLPTILLSLRYTYLIFYKFIIDIFYVIWKNKIYSNIFFLESISIILCIIFTIGFSMWIINLTFYEIKIKKYLLITYNIVTFICMLKLTFEITSSFIG